MINTVNARTTPRKRFMNIAIIFDQKEDHQHKKCISNSKREEFSRIMTFNDHCNHLWRKKGKCLKFSYKQNQGDQKDWSKIKQDFHPQTSNCPVCVQGYGSWNLKHP
jgi:hypothetical protein